MTDFGILCGIDGKEVRCHSMVLFQMSPFFNYLMMNDDTVKKTSKYEVKEASSRQIESVLKYMYCRDFDIHHEDVVHLWVLGYHFGIIDLAIGCEAQILRMINEKNVESFSKLAEDINSECVKNYCRDFQTRK